jgi:hypothetical protein
MNEKEASHPAHPMDRTANCSHGGWFTLAKLVLYKVGGIKNIWVSFKGFSDVVKMDIIQKII